MPTTASTVGPLALPIPPGAANSAIDDPTLSGLAAYFAFWLNADLNAKLASLNTGREDDTQVTTAVPAGNVFLWNPQKPGAFFVRGAGDGAQHPLPALYVWDDNDKRKPFSILYGMRERAVKAMWIFEEALLPGWLVDRFGLRPAACATLMRAVEQRYHPGFNARETIAVQLQLAGDGIVYQGSERTFLSPIVEPGGMARTGSDQPTIRAYPAAIASYLVYELEAGQVALPSDATPDISVVAFTNDQGDLANAVRVGSHVVPAPPYLTST